LTTPERLGRNAFGRADWLRLQSEHERFLREIKDLPRDKKALEISNAINYILENKNGYLLEVVNLFRMLYKEETQWTNEAVKENWRMLGVVINMLNEEMENLMDMLSKVEGK